MALQRGAPAVNYYLAGANCSAGNPPPRGNPGLKRTRLDAILKKFDFSAIFPPRRMPFWKNLIEKGILN
jgi:hypothetical protein